MKRYAFIYNPAARDGRSQAVLAKLKAHIDQLESASLFRSKEKGDIGKLVKEQLSKYDIFVACGGDGTIRAVATELVHTDKTLGIVPLGTGNDLCKTLKVPTDLTRAFMLLHKQLPTKIDVGKCNNILFLNVLGFGFDGLTNQYAHHLEWLPAVLRYPVAALKASLTHQRFGVTILEDGYKKELIMLTIANGRVEGDAFWIAPNASICDGLLNIVQVSAISKMLIPILLPLFLLKKPPLIPQVHRKTVSSCSVQLDTKVAIHADGEIITTEEKSFNIEVLPKALDVICGL